MARNQNKGKLFRELCALVKKEKELHAERMEASEEHQQTIDDALKELYPELERVQQEFEKVE
jgi:hypothetical protein